MKLNKKIIIEEYKKYKETNKEAQLILKNDYSKYEEFVETKLRPSNIKWSNILRASTQTENKYWASRIHSIAS